METGFMFNNTVFELYSLVVTVLRNSHLKMLRILKMQQDSGQSVKN